MNSMMSLKLRLMLIILMPLLLVSMGIAYWAYENTRDRAANRFDASLLITATAISQDIALSNGDALSLRTRDLINDTSGGQVFYHAYAPDGVFVTGYATPPVSAIIRKNDNEPLTYFDASYLGEVVRGIQLRNQMQIDGLRGVFNFTVWQNTTVRDNFVKDQTRQTFIIITVLGVSVATIVWVGVSLGLRPLIDLQRAIAIRSSKDLTPIRRAVPHEVKGIVSTLNSLLEQVDTSIKTKNDFISNAAHQLRNPIAGVMAMAEAVRSAPTPDAAMQRTDDLYYAASQTNDLANKLLSFERANLSNAERNHTPVELTALINQVIKTAGRRVKPLMQLELIADDKAIMVSGDELMIGEAITNLIDNATLHGGDTLSIISVRLSQQANYARIEVADNGVGISDDSQLKALERFGQIDPTRGTGLGLSIVQSVANTHNGQLTLQSNSMGGLSAIVELPIINERVDG